MKTYYIDTCIWLNLFKKEGDPARGIPYWQIARNFIDKVGESNDKIIVSTIVLKELSCKLGHGYNKALNFIKALDCVEIIKTDNSDYNFARELEQKEKIKLSFYDYLHIAIAKRLKTILITRDKDLIAVASKHIQVNKPEDLVS